MSVSLACPLIWPHSLSELRAVDFLVGRWDVPAFVEKPAAANVEEAVELAEPRSGVRLESSSVTSDVFAAAFRRAAEIATGSEFGEPTLASFS